MAGSSLLTLIDDIASLLDDVSLMSKMAAKKTAGVLGDDLALNAQQVTGVKADRELPVVWSVAKGSLINKAILVPLALLISAFAPWAITPLLMVGGAYLCYEGFEKVFHSLSHGKAAQEEKSDGPGANEDAAAYEKRKVKGAIRTDFVLSAEIIAITLGTVAGATFSQQVIVLCGIAVVMTLGVYGIVAGIVRLDDLGLYLSRKRSAVARSLGGGIVRAAPYLMKTLSIVGTVAMFMVGGGILTHGLPPVHHLFEDWASYTTVVPTFGHLLQGVVPALLNVAFGLVAGGVVCIGTHSVDLFNRILFSAKVVFLVVMLGLMLPNIHQTNLMTLPLEQGLALSAIPVIFTSFGFHGSVPSIVNYMGGNIRKLRWVFIIGSAIPLIAYIFWQLATLGSISSDTFVGILAQQAGLNGLLQAVRDAVASPHVELAVHLFADLALATSFLGVALGLFDFLADLFKRQDNVRGRLQTGAITFLPPLAFALFYPRGFVLALGFAAIALSVLALLLPSLLVWKTRQKHQAQYRVWGGTPALALVFVCGVTVIAIQLGIASGMLPAVG